MLIRIWFNEWYDANLMTKLESTADVYELMWKYCRHPTLECCLVDSVAML